MGQPVLCLLRVKQKVSEKWQIFDKKNSIRRQIVYACGKLYMVLLSIKQTQTARKQFGFGLVT